MRQRIHRGDCRVRLQVFDPEEIHLVLTDPPYFLDGLDDSWSKGRKQPTGSVGLPPGMKYDPNQGKQLYDFLKPVAKELMRVLVPGGFCLMFAQPRLSHNTAAALEDTGFEIRDQIIWERRNKSQFKGFKIHHLVDRNPDLSDTDKTHIKELAGNLRAPILRNIHETIVVAQKPKEGTMVSNFYKHHTGLIAPRQLEEPGRTPATIYKCPKPPKNGHLTPKPIPLLKELIHTYSLLGQHVLDPFMGSGTTGVAAVELRRLFSGIEKDRRYFMQACNDILEARPE